MAVEQVAEASSLLMPHLGGGGQVGLDEGEVGEALPGRSAGSSPGQRDAADRAAPAAPGYRCGPVGRTQHLMRIICRSSCLGFRHDCFLVTAAVRAGCPDRQVPGKMRLPTRISKTLRIAALAAAAAVTLAMQAGPAGRAMAAAPGRSAVPSGAAARSSPVAGPVTQVSTTCTTGPGGNAEVESASDPRHGYVYDAWISCGQIGFARSADGGRTWSTAIDVPRQAPTSDPSWDPAITVGPSGAVYVGFMIVDIATRSYYPVVDISTDHGSSFSVHKLGAPSGDYGDRDFIAVGPRGQIYVTWDFAPTVNGVQLVCFPGGSCAYTAGDLNEVVQTSTDGGQTWSQIVPIAPGFPDSGSMSAPILVTPSGRLDVLFERYQVLSTATLQLGPGHDYFTSSADGGKTWSAPVRLGLASATLSTDTWWIDGSLGRDAAGDLYATWDTQQAGADVGWLSYSVTGGRTWSPPVEVTSTGPATNIVQVLGGARGRAYVGLLTDSSGGYVQYLREFSVADGWTTPWVQVSQVAGLASSWAGDTFGLARDGGEPGNHQVAVSWGSTLPGGQPQIWAAVVNGLP